MNIHAILEQLYRHDIDGLNKNRCVSFKTTNYLEYFFIESNCGNMLKTGVARMEAGFVQIGYFYNFYSRALKSKSSGKYEHLWVRWTLISPYAWIIWAPLAIAFWNFAINLLV